MTCGKRNFYDRKFQNMDTWYKNEETPGPATEGSYPTTHFQGCKTWGRAWDRWQDTWKRFL